MGEITTIGLDLAKDAFHVVGCDAHGKVVVKKMLRRAQLLSYFANLAPYRVGMEACANSTNWGSTSPSIPGNWRPRADAATPAGGCRPSPATDWPVSVKCQGANFW